MVFQHYKMLLNGSHGPSHTASVLFGESHIGKTWLWCVLAGILFEFAESSNSADLSTFQAFFSQEKIIESVYPGFRPDH